MTFAIRLRREHVDAMIAHALEDAPVECCGVLASKDGFVASVNRARNLEASPYRFKIDPLEYAKLERRLDDAGEAPTGFYHSHTGSDPVPSPTDVRMMGAFFGPPYVHFVIGVKDREKPEVRCWYIQDGDKIEQKFEIVE
jgi:proteasome lid subunit RPN8/RPN11